MEGCMRFIDAGRFGGFTTGLSLPLRDLTPHALPRAAHHGRQPPPTCTSLVMSNPNCGSTSPTTLATTPSRSAAVAKSGSRSNRASLGGASLPVAGSRARDDRWASRPEPSPLSCHASRSGRWPAGGWIWLVHWLANRANTCMQPSPHFSRHERRHLAASPMLMLCAARTIALPPLCRNIWRRSTSGSRPDSMAALRGEPLGGAGGWGGCRGVG